MKPGKAKTEIKKLRDKIREADYKYYIDNDPLISDKEYDSLMKELKGLEEKYPRFVTSESPTQRVSGGLIDRFPARRHKVKMLSLDNTYSLDELKEWEKKIRRNLKTGREINYMAELKIDGISCSLTYQKGKLKRGLTRGDGQSGEDITANLKTIASIPLKLRGRDIPETLEVRGEVYISKGGFAAINTQRAKEGKPPFANARNAAGGSLKLLDPKLVAQRDLRCFIHSFGWVKGWEFRTQKDFFARIKNWGLRTQKENKFCSGLSQVIDYCSRQQQERDKLNYEADGVVVKVNDRKLQKKMGATAKSPRWAVAYKFPARRKTTRVKKVEFGVGRTGIITPVAILKPVECGGAVIRKSTLHNFDEIKRLGLKIGDTVLIERAGEVIPKIIKVIFAKRTEKEKEIAIPKNCPVCGGAVDKEEVYYFCLNPNCPSKLKRSLIHFACRGAMDIEGLGGSLAEELIERKMVKNIADIYKLKKDNLRRLPLFKEKKAAKLIKAISASKKQPLSRLLFGLGIPHVGKKTAVTLSDKFASLDKIARAQKEDFEKIEEFGPVMAESIVKFFSQEPVGKTLRELKKSGVNPEAKTYRKSGKLTGKTFVFTGQLDNFSRSQAQKKVEESGGKWSSSLSNKTDFLVAGQNPGSKYKEAEKKGIKIISQSAFLGLIPKKHKK